MTATNINMDYIGPLELLVIQGSPFCNLNCSYCYLPNRTDKKRISNSTLEKLFSKLFSSGIVRQDFTITWHAGEPMALPIEFYEFAVNLSERLNTTEFKITHNFQTNGTLINDKWCDFFKNHNIKVSLSLDGPKFLHDKTRLDRKGFGTFDKVIDGIACLNKHGIRFSVISVISDNSLDFAAEYYSFFKSINPISVGLNIEEIENFNTQSTLYQGNIALERYDSFIGNLLDLYYSDPDEDFKIREFLQLESFLLSKDKFSNGFGQQTIPFKILSVAADGGYSTFSPELLDASSKIHGNFVFGNVNNEGSLLDILNTPKFHAVYAEILKGISNCKSSCNYFPVCGGGTPSNKLGETGRFDSTVTKHCTFRFQHTFDVFFNKMEAEFSE